MGVVDKSSDLSTLADDKDGKPERCAGPVGPDFGKEDAVCGKKAFATFDRSA
jgi:hypothetical protein